MASSYSTDLKLELMVTGENSGTWGDKTNTNLNLIQQAVAGYQSIALTSTNTTLSMTNATISNARNAVIEFTGTLAANATVYVESGIEKTYTIKNSTTGAFTLALNQVGGSSVIWGTTEKNIKGVYLDGTNANTIDLSTLGGAINSSASIGDFVIGPNELDTSAVTSVKIASFAVTSAKLDTSSVTSVKVASFAITSAALDTASVTSVKVASGAIGTAQLATTGVTAATYTAATITVAADGRITSASSGSAGAGGFVLTRTTAGPSSGTHTAGANANRLGIYMYGGGGGSGKRQEPMCSMATIWTGGSGGYGYFNVPITQPYAVPFVVGGAGNAAPNLGVPNPGNAGQASNFGPLVSNAGAAGTVNASGAPGNAPQASLVYTPSTYTGTPGSAGSSNASTPGTPGFLAVYENSGT